MGCGASIPEDDKPQLEDTGVKQEPSSCLPPDPDRGLLTVLNEWTGNAKDKQDLARLCDQLRAGAKTSGEDILTGSEDVLNRCCGCG